MQQNEREAGNLCSRTVFDMKASERRSGHSPGQLGDTDPTHAESYLHRDADMQNY